MAMVLAVIAVAAIAAYSLAYLAEQAVSVQISSNAANATQARLIAESGLEMAAAYVLTTANWRTQKTPGTWVANQSLTGQPNGTFTIVAQDGWDSNGDGIVEGNSDFSDATHAVTLTATGDYKGAVQSAQVVLTPRPARVSRACQATGTIVLSGSGTLIDSFDSNLGAYGGGNVGSQALVATNATSANTITVQSGAQINGAAAIGPGGNAATAVNTTGGTITGGASALPEALPMPALAAPTDLGPVLGDRTYESFQGNTIFTLGTNLHVNSLTIKANAKLRISGNITILVEGNVSIYRESGIEVLPGSTLKLYFRGTLTINDGSRNVVSGPNLSRLQFLNLGTSPVVLADSTASTQGVIVSPNGAVSMTTGFQLYGAVIAASLTVTGGAKLHEDKNITTGADIVTFPNWVVSGYHVWWLARL